MKLKKVIKSCDYFSHEIKLNNGKGTAYSTLIGGIMSILINVFMFIFILKHFLEMLNYDNDTITQRTSYIT